MDRLKSRESTILAVHPGALGDVILFGRLLSMLKGPVRLVAGREKAELLVALGVVRPALGFESLPMEELFTDLPLAACRLPGLLGRCDRLVSCFPAGDRNAELRLAAMCAAKDAAFLPTRPPEGFSGHLLELWCDLLGVEFVPPASPWRLPDAAIKGANRELKRIGVDAGSRCLVIHPGAGAKEKCWPLERFLELARNVARAVVFILGPAESDRWSAETIESVRRVFPLLLQPSLTVLAGVLAGAGAYVGNDSGVSHLAGAVGTPTVAMFGPSRPENFAPVGPNVKVLAARSVTGISTKQVLQALADLQGFSLRKRRR
ncbi:MAG: glycosyltransferase family 9 protein [Planctomycetota bacterium]|nr:glycosyltransferase family 9 protein [Planctomycetota bacterium]